MAGQFLGGASWWSKGYMVCGARLRHLLPLGRTNTRMFDATSATNHFIRDKRGGCVVYLD
jgi:hypothetical protein